MGRRSLTALLALALASAGLPLQAIPAVAVSPNVVISQVYGGGGNTGAPLQNDFIELFNRGTAAVSVAGWSIQYASAAGPGLFGGSTTVITPLSGTIAPGGYLLVQEAAGTNLAPPLPTPDVTDASPINLSATGAKLALVNSTTPLGCNGTPTACTPAALATVVDLVGWDGANFFETAAAPTTSNTTAVVRKSGGCQDTDNNAADFEALAPGPRNSASPTNPCSTGDTAPSVVFRAPAAGSTGVAADSSVTIGFSEQVTLGPSWYAISCATSGAHTATVTGGPDVFTLDPDTDFAPLEWCTVTVIAGQVTDQDSADPPDNMTGDDVYSFQTAEVFTCGDPATPIHDVQGAGSASPMVGTTVTVEGVVVGDYQKTPSEFGGFYLQEEDADADADPLTSEGIFVFRNEATQDVAMGDVVRVKGTVTEFSTLTEIAPVSLVLVCSSGASVTPTAVSLPVASVGDLEAFEGMLVSFDQTLTVTEVFNLGRFGEVLLSGIGRQYTPTAVAAPGAGALAVADANRRARIVLDDGNNLQNIDPTRYPQGGLSASNTLRVGDSLDGLTGVMDFRFSAYRIQPVGAIEFARTNPRPAAPEPVGGDLTVASFNVLNFFNGDGLGGGFPTARGASTPLELERQLAKEVSALVALDADIVGLMELENDAPPNSAIEDLVAALNAVMGAGTYSFIDTGVIGTDAIKVALIYKPGSVSPIGAYQTIDSADDPRFIDTLNRPSLAQTFEHVLTGERLTVVVNHLKSKGSACPGDPDLGDGQGNCNGTRTAAAEALVDWLAGDPTGSGDPDVLIIGDLNSYTYEDPITALTEGGFANLVAAFGGESAYSYVFQGESGYLDHALANASLVAQVTGVTDWHINPDEPAALDYNMEFKNDNQDVTFYDSGPYRSSDHDPVLVGIDLTPIAGTGGKLEGTPQWVGGVKTKLNVIASAGEARGRVSYEGDGRYYLSTVIHSIAVDGDDATVFGSFGSVEFRLDVHDGGSDREDTLRLRTSDGYDSGVLAQLRGNLTVWP